jgi:hypothetical protein
MAAPHPRLLLGDSSDCVYPANILDVLVELVVCIREAGSLYHDVGALRRRRAESEERAAAIRADLQRFARQAEIGLRATASESKWGEVQDHAEKAIGSLHGSVKRWQRYYGKMTERGQRRFQARISGLEDALRVRLGRFVIARRTEAPSRTLYRVLEERCYRDVMEVELLGGLSMRCTLANRDDDAPKKVKSFARGVEIRLGMRKPLFRGEEPNVVALDDLYVLAATIGPSGAELQLARKPAGDDLLRVGLALQQGIVTAVGQQDDGPQIEVPAEDRHALTVLWRGLQMEVADAAHADATLLELHLDQHLVVDADGVFAALERVVDHYRPIVADLAAHSPNNDELSIKVEVDGAHREEVFVYRADLGQHLLALHPDVRGRVAIRELLGRDEDYVVESDLIDLGAIMQPDAGEDSDIIELTQPLTGMDDVSGPVLELVAGDIELVDSGEEFFTDEEISACFDLIGVRRTAST